MRRQAQQVQPWRKLEISTRMPASLIQDQEDVFVWPHPVLLGKGRQSKGKGYGRDRWHEQPAGLSALRLHKSVEVPPWRALADYGPHSTPRAGPDATQDRCEAKAVF